MTSPFEPQLATLIRQRGVLGCLVVGERDGIIVDVSLQVGVDGPTVAALAASLYRRARVSARTAGLGGVSFLQLEADHGHVCAAGQGELVLVTIAESRAPVGRIRATMLQLVEALV